VEALAARCQASVRGLRALLDYLAVDGFLTRTDGRYALAPTAAAFLDANAPTYVGSAIHFLASPAALEGFARLTDAVRLGGTALPADGSLAPEHPMWIDFARAMGPAAAAMARLLAALLAVDRLPGGRVLDVAAGHGFYGITLAQVNPRLRVTALDWRNVLRVAEENARRAGVADRFDTLAGNALEIPLGGPYDLVLIPNFLHHFDPATCERFLGKVHAALAPGGRAVIVEFIPDADRLGPPAAVRFALVMLAGTPAGDAYTFSEYQAMLRHAGFSGARLHELPPSPARVVIAER
jgi:ubiquinone/menaquinone biosynthesis C-methylase UbiE